MSTPPTVLAYGDRGLLVELADTDEVLSWARAVRAAAPPGVADLVPAARTLLVVLDDDADVREVRSALGGLSGQVDELEPVEEDLVHVEVRYDGEDLPDVARLTGLSQDEVVEAHVGSEWRVGFGGFAPGFGYLVGGDPRLEVPRRDSARTAVPAGAVGLAGVFSGVYPRESPGGWQLIGTTDAVLWDLERDPPALLRPGVRVRFVRVGGAT